MPEQRNFLLGRGERLAEDVQVRASGGPKEAPYTFTQARDRIRSMLQHTVRDFDKLPQAACPQDQVVAKVKLNPEYLAKTAYPGALLQAVGLKSVGSRQSKVTPERRSRGRETKETITTELFVAGERRALKEWSAGLANWQEDHRGAMQLAAIEQIAAIPPSEKIKSIQHSKSKLLFEVVLHAGELQNDNWILDGFRHYTEELGLDLDVSNRFYAGGLCFLQLEAPKSEVENIARFSFLRAIREMPRLRMLKPAFRGAAIPGSTVTLPTSPAIDPQLKVAIFDGGLPNKHLTELWARSLSTTGVGATAPELSEHGQAVTSALLFGHLEPSQTAPIPYSNVDHYRVLDANPQQKPDELFEVLKRIQSVLSQRRYDFINLSIGPELPIEDDDIHVWTAVLDEYLSDGKTLASIAVGNGGERDASLGYNRVQVPGDCVNGLAIGAADSRGSTWKRAPYSSVGPGRAPGLIKPDVLHFGGSIGEPFLVLAPERSPKLLPTGGTSFAAPNALRLGLGVRAHIGPVLEPLAIRALLIHNAQPGEGTRQEIGWGRLPQNIEDIVVCPPGIVRVVYQGEITASKYMRIPLPVPLDQLDGMVGITATICYASATDPHHSGNYTRCGLEVVFRPKDDVFAENAQHPKTHSFFRPADMYLTEEELRRDAHKWDNCLHHSVRMRGNGLKNPVFDIHYNARSDGHQDTQSHKMAYAMVITVEAKREKDIYNKVFQRYRTQLEQLTPVIDIPVRTSGS